MKIGDKVTMNDNYYVSQQNVGKVWTVASNPFKACGCELVILDGDYGAYKVDGLDLIEKKPYRGKRIKDGQWVYGWLLGENIIVTDYETDFSKHTGVETRIKESFVVFHETVEYVGDLDRGD